MNNAQQFTPAFVNVDGRELPDIRKAFGRQAYGTKGQHEQCQPRISPEDVRARRKAFFSETLFVKKSEESDKGDE